MGLLHCILFVSWLSFVVSQQESVDENGVLHIDDARGLRPGGSIWNFHSPKYPDPSPPNLHQTWRVETFPDARLRIHCIEIRIPYRVPGECDPEYELVIEDGDEIKRYCQADYDVKFLSKTNALNIWLKTGEFGHGVVNCTVQGREMGPYGEVTEAPTTPRPVYVEPTFRSIISQEIDSSEHGVSPGRKRTSCKCGSANTKNSRIVGGREALVHEFPHMVALVLEEQPYFVFCGGSIVTPRHILTAAHCTHHHLESNIAVRVGEHNYLSEDETNRTQIIRVIKIIEHEQFNKKLPLIFDVSLMVLERSIEFNKFIGPICLPTKRLSLDNKYVKISGWGRISHYGPGSTVLKVVNLRVVPEVECFGSMTPDRSRLCTYARSKSSCMGDSGGPVMWLDPETNRYTLVGLVSYGPFCGGENPMVSADVTSFADWVHTKIRETQQGVQGCIKL